MKRVFKWKEAGFTSWEAYLKAYNKKKMRAWYVKNKKKHLENCREYRRAHREEVAYKRWYEKKYVAK